MMTATTALAPDCFDYIRTLVQQRAAILLDPGKAYLVQSRLLPVARENGLDSIESLVGKLRKPGSQPLVRQVVEAMTTNETSFFRDLHPFEALRTVVLPDLIQRRSTRRTLTIWSNACSSGQEVYTVAMILREHFPQLASWRVRLLASDLSTQVLARARQGRFNQAEVNRGLPMPMLLKYFTREGLCWQIKDELRQMVEFRQLNLVEPFPALPPCDVVFLRNVLIYFAPPTKTEILNRIRTVMPEDGYLYLGGAETTMNLNVRFQRVSVGKSACYQPG